MSSGRLSTCTRKMSPGSPCPARGCRRVCRRELRSICFLEGKSRELALSAGLAGPGRREQEEREEEGWGLPLAVTALTAITAQTNHLMVNLIWVITAVNGLSTVQPCVDSAVPAAAGFPPPAFLSPKPSGNASRAGQTEA